MQVLDASAVACTVDSKALTGMAQLKDKTSLKC
jgi:hypothetical protein